MSTMNWMEKAERLKYELEARKKLVQEEIEELESRKEELQTKYEAIANDDARKVFTEFLRENFDKIEYKVDSDVADLALLEAYRPVATVTNVYERKGYVSEHPYDHWNNSYTDDQCYRLTITIPREMIDNVRANLEKD